jgi:tetratricopeptide (TPR) repeat protein
LERVITRILALSVLLVFFSGGVWYVFRDTPEKQILRWRAEAEKVLFDKTSDLQQAEALNEKILKLIPYSAYDLLFKAKICERRGTPEGLRQAVLVYDKVLSGGDPAALGVAFLKARACRSLGLLSEARGSLFSVVDSFPFESMMELGETALSLLSAAEALRYYSKALEVATTKLEEARAHEGMANTYRLMIALGSASLPASKGQGSQEPKEDQEVEQDGTRRTEGQKSLRQSCRNSFRKALEIVRILDLPPSQEEANRRILWASLLSEKLALFKEPQESPCWDALNWIKLKTTDYAGILKELSPELRICRVSLRLQTAREEVDVLPQGLAAEFLGLAEKELLEILGASPEEAKASLLSPTDQQGPRLDESSAQAASSRIYLQNLLAVSKIYLASPDFHRLLADPSPLALSRRISDAASSSNPDTASIFSLVSGFALLKAGRTAEADALLEKYLSNVAPDGRPSQALDVAEQVLRLCPSDPLVFRYVDRFAEYGGRPLELIGKRISLLVSARAREPLAEESSRRLDATIKKAGEDAANTAERVALAKVLYGVRGRDAAIASIRETRRRFPDDFALRRVLADLYLEKAKAAALEGEKEEATSAYREALREHLQLFIKSPSESQDTLTSMLQILQMLEKKDKEEEIGLLPDVKGLFPTASEPSLEHFAAALRAFFQRQFGPAIDRASTISEPGEFEPFLPFLKGSCHVGLMLYLQRDAAAASSDIARQALNEQREEHLRLALEEFKKGGDFVASQLELVNLEFQVLPEDADVPDGLLERIQNLTKSDKVEYRADFLLARALARRFEYRYRDKTVKNSELARILSREQRALRSAIRRRPVFAPAYLALAETFLGSSSNQAPLESSTAAAREIFAPDFQKAINVLKAAPTPDEQITARLADCLEGSGRLEEAGRCLEQLALTRPDADYFSRLFLLYLETKDPGLALLLDQTPPAAESPLLKGKLPRERFQFLLNLRKRFEELPEHQPVRYSALGMAAARKEADASNESERKRWREQIIENYTRALDSYDAKGIPVPVVVLNNLAWYLAEDPKEEHRAWSTEVASRAKGLVSNPGPMPEVYDTYAWTLYRNGKFVEAEQSFRDLIKAVDAPGFRYHLAVVLFDLKKFDEALAEVRRALDTSKSFAEQVAAHRLEAEVREARRRAAGE